MKIKQLIINIHWPIRYISSPIDLKVHIFFSFTNLRSKHNRCDDLSKVDYKQNISFVILFIKFLVYQWDPRHVALHTYLFTLQSMCSIWYTTTFLFISIISILFILLIIDEHKDFSSLRKKNWNWTYSVNSSVRPHFNSVFDLLLDKSKISSIWI